MRVQRRANVLRAGVLGWGRLGCCGRRTSRSHLPGLPSQPALLILAARAPFDQPSRSALAAGCQAHAPPGPPSSLPRRRALADDVLGGYNVPKGSDIFISTWNLHRCVRVCLCVRFVPRLAAKRRRSPTPLPSWCAPWPRDPPRPPCAPAPPLPRRRSPDLWDEPEAFNPDRFPVDAPTPNETTHDFKYLPFGGGRRKCIGEGAAARRRTLQPACSEAARRHRSPGWPSQGVGSGDDGETVTHFNA